jgi:polyhydroxyalkanoate synthesis regulator phasin
MAKLPPVRKRTSYSDIGSGDLVFALFWDRLLGDRGAMQEDREMAPIATKTLDAPAGAFTVFKTAKGLRWLAFSSNGYEDRDKEIVSTKALGADVERTAVDGKFGPLRWWHLGHPDPTDPDAPWGPGVDLGWADFSAMSGPFLVESGTFNSEAIGHAIARKAKDLALSLGFFHPRGEPDAKGVFHHIRRFERSLAPAGKVSNPLTAFYVPGATRVNTEQINALKALMPEVPTDELEGLISKYTSASTKAAEAAGLRFKTAGQPVYQLPDGTPAVIIEGQLVTLKHAGLKADDDPKSGMPPRETEAEAAMPEPDDDGDDDEGEVYAGDMTLGEFKAFMVDAMKEAMSEHTGSLKALATKLDMAEKMGAMLDEFKGYMSGTATKDSQRAEQISTLETQIKTLSAQLGELLGDAPAAVQPASTATATVVDGIAAPERLAVTKKGEQPEHTHPADQIGGWLTNLAAPSA